ncbi:MAG: DUF1553 domain-containing protein [Verrucomicrobiae bacterium]|nr:DUF1553 domain-containing protein [Verrucomicrobiae bacterium]
MKPRVWSLILVFGLVTEWGSAEEVLFHERVRPLIEARCVGCHGPDQRKGGLRLDSREAALAGGYEGPAVVPGRPEDSLLMLAVRHAREDLAMPPKERLADADVKALERWIREGAPWPEAVQGPAGGPAAPEDGERLGDAWSDPRNPIVRLFHGQRLDLWSLRPLAKPAVPVNAGREGRPESAHPIDAFLRASASGSTSARRMAPEADRRTLVRRLFFELTGMPPSPEELEWFLRDRAPGAYERWVDRLLHSPRYGEHLARLWLDVVRYSDSNGFDWDEFRPEAWRFRDYVVRSFNADKPYDRFLVEQLAGDEMLAGAPRTAAERDLLIATGYLRIGPQDNSASLFNEQARARSEWLSDLTETTGSAFLGLTLSCCRCHDHKYDPLSQADHFRLRAFFEPVEYGDALALDLADEQEAIRGRQEEIDREIEPLEREREAIWGVVKDRLRAERVAALTDEERRLLARALDSGERAEAIERRIEPGEKEIAEAATGEERERHALLGREIEAKRKARPAFTRGLLATDRSGPVPATRIHFQGDPRSERDLVSPGYPSILDPNPAVIEAPPNPATTGRRWTLAHWIASPDNPLTARVMVNRVWQWLMGEGLVTTPNDFGWAGARPGHPELLDWLAREFMAQGWSLKGLHRLILTSAAYRQTSRVEAEGGSPGLAEAGAFVGPRPLRRLSAEQLRDALLGVSGRLRDVPGGRPVWLDLPPDILKANPAFLDDNAEKTKGWYPSPAGERPVRSLYLVQKRTVRLPFLETFDQPENSVSCPQRTSSIVAPQALTLLNGDEAIAAAQALGERVLAEAGSDPEAQVRRAFVRALQREPDPEEMMACRRFLKGSDLVQLCRALLNVNEFVFVD